LRLRNAVRKCANARSFRGRKNRGNNHLKHELAMPYATRWPQWVSESERSTIAYVCSYGHRYFVYETPTFSLIGAVTPDCAPKCFETRRRSAAWGTCSVEHSQRAPLVLIASAPFGCPSDGIERHREGRIAKGRRPS